MFSCEFCEILKKTYFKGHLQTTVSEEISEDPSKILETIMNSKEMTISLPSSKLQIT